MTLGKNQRDRPVGGERCATVHLSAQLDGSKWRVSDVCAGGFGRILLRLRVHSQIECRSGQRVSCNREGRFMARPVLWCDILICPAGEGAGNEFRVGLSHKYSWGFRSSSNLRGPHDRPRCSWRISTTLAGFLGTTARAPCLR